MRGQASCRALGCGASTDHVKRWQGVPVTYDGRTFPSYIAVARFYALDPTVVKRRLSLGQPLEVRRINPNRR